MLRERLSKMWEIFIDLFFVEKIERLDQTREFKETQQSIVKLRQSAVNAHIIAKGIAPELKGLERSLSDDN